MKIIARVILIILLGLLVNNCSSAQVNRNNSTELFVQFKELFQEIELPIIWNRQDIGRFAMPSYGQKSSFYEIPVEFFSYIPKDLIESDSTSNIRALYQLPSKNDIHLFIIVTDYMYDRYNEGELYSILTQLYLIGYDSSGKMLFYKLIAGNHEDKWDKLLTFNLDYIFETRHYEFLGGTMRHPTRNHLVGLMKHTITICEITANGTINCTSETIKGFFDSLPDGDYELVKIYEDD